MHASPLPKWAMKGYAHCYRVFKQRTFTYHELLKILHAPERKRASVLLTHLKRNGWLTVELDPVDGRKRRYTLRPLDSVIQELA